MGDQQERNVVEWRSPAGVEEGEERGSSPRSRIKAGGKWNSSRVLRSRGFQKRGLGKVRKDGRNENYE